MIQHSSPTTQPALLTVPEVASYFRVSSQVVHQWIKSGRINGAQNIGTPKKANYRIPRESLAGVVIGVHRTMPEGVEEII
jgi:excisionase family DNA binding protein